MLTVEILILTRPNLRDREFTVFAGQLFLKQLYDSDTNLEETKEIYLEFPERWLNILELRALPSVLATRCPNLEKLTILTGNEHLLTVYHSKYMKRIDDSSKYPEIAYRPGVRYSPLPEPNKSHIFTSGA